MQRINARHTRINDEVSIKASALQLRGKVVDVGLLVADLAALGVGRTCVDGPGVVVCDVGGQTAHGGGGPCVLVHGGVQLGCRADVGGPAEPSCVA